MLLLVSLQMVLLEQFKQCLGIGSRGVAGPALRARAIMVGSSSKSPRIRLMTQITSRKFIKRLVN